MRLEDVAFDGATPIDAYGGGGFRIAGAFHSGGVVLAPDAPPAAFAPATFDDITLALLEPLLEAVRAGRIDVALIGAGDVGRPIPRDIRAAFHAAGIGIESMATGPACRTYNVLLSESRRVGAALIAAG